MTSFSSYTQDNPVADNSPAPGLLSKIGSGISNYFSNVGKDVSSSVNEATNSYSNYASNPNPTFGQALGTGANLAKNVSGAILSPIAELPVFKQAGQAFNDIGQSIVNSPVGNAGTDFLAKHVSPQTLGTTSDTVQTGLNMAGIEGTVKAPEQIGNIWDKVKGGAPTDPLSTRTADATPAYNKDLIGQNVRNPQGDIVPRVNEGEGLTGQRTVNTSNSEAEQGQELANLKDYPDKGTALQKSFAIGKGIGTEAESMRAGLQTEDKASPLDTETEKGKITDMVTSHMPDDIRERIGAVTPEDQAMLKGMQEKAGAPQPPGGKFDLRSPGDHGYLPKTATGRYFGKVLDALNEYNGTREGKLDLRQKIEKAFQSEGGKYAYGSDSQNALAEINSDIRNSLNKDLADTTQNTDTQASLKKQTNLYRAKDTLETKARSEAASQIGRLFQNHPILHRLVTRDALRVLGTASGAGLVTSFITKLLQGKE